MDDTSEVKSKVDIVSLISEYVDLKKSGRNFKAPCPFHPEKTPSFMVSPELQIYKCFGCGESGDCFSFLQKYEGMDFYESLKFLADKTGVKLKPRSFDISKDKEHLYQINSAAAYFYRYVLLKHPAGRVAYNYLTRERRLTPETINLFGIGFSPDAKFALKSYMNKRRFSSFDLERSGITYKGDRGEVDRFRGRVIFPLTDHRGNVVGFAGRILPENKNPDVAKYINSPETDIYHKSKVLYGLNTTRGFIKKSGFSVVVEGEIDMISSYQSGIKNVVAIKGSSLTVDQAKLISRYAPRVVLAMDTDFAGNDAARRGLEVLQKENLEVSVAKLMNYKDPDEAAHKDPELLKRTINEAIPVWDFIIGSILEKHQKIGETERVSKEAVPILSSIADEIVRAHYINMLASKIGVPSEAVGKEVERFMSKSQILPTANQEPNAGEVFVDKTLTRREILEDRLLCLSFNTDPTLLVEPQSKKIFKSLFSKRIIEELIYYFEKRKKFDLKTFSGGLPPEVFSRFSEVILGGPSFAAEDGGGVIAREAEVVKRELQKVDIKERLDELTSEIKIAETSKDIKSLDEKKTLFAKLSKKFSALAENEIKGIIS